MDSHRWHEGIAVQGGLGASICAVTHHRSEDRVPRVAVRPGR